MIRSPLRQVMRPRSATPQGYTCVRTLWQIYSTLMNPSLLQERSGHVQRSQADTASLDRP